MASNLPQTITAGETLWIAAANTLQDRDDITIDDVTPAGGYTLAYQFAASTPLSVAAVANGANTGWTLEVTGAQTLTWAPGVVAYTGIATHTASGRTFAVERGSILVAASPLRVSSWAAVLVAIDAAIASYAANPNGSISMEGMSITYRNLAQLTELRDYANYRLQQDTSNRPVRIIRTRFNLL
jgi:hypothetical protein